MKNFGVTLPSFFGLLPLFLLTAVVYILIDKCCSYLTLVFVSYFPFSIIAVVDILI